VKHRASPMEGVVAFVRDPSRARSNLRMRSTITRQSKLLVRSITFVIRLTDDTTPKLRLACNY
jgi:hypothetical protein